jgi:hypothetical protein
MLLDIYRQINQLEKSKLPVQKELEAKVEKKRADKLVQVEKQEYFPIFIWAAFINFLLEILLTTLYFRRIP